MSRYSYAPIDASRIRTRSISARSAKVSLDDFGRPYEKGSAFDGFLKSLPRILAGNDFRQLVESVGQAHSKGRAVIWGLGAHVIKCGLNPVLIDLMSRGFVTALALNGAGAIHDFEIGISGATSEDVEKELETGDFGMSEETIRWMNEAIHEGEENGLGLGEAFGRSLERHLKRFPHRELCLMHKAYQLKIPVTVHVAIGTDTIHNHPALDGCLLGKASLQDFRLFTSVVRDLDEGGVYLNCGSAVILPEVFLKAVSLIKNLGDPLRDFTTVNLDFIQHYRPHQNVVKRPTRGLGRGIALTGHHELMIPLLAAALIEAEV